MPWPHGRQRLPEMREPLKNAQWVEDLEISVKVRAAIARAPGEPEAFRGWPCIAEGGAVSGGVLAKGGQTVIMRVTWGNVHPG